MLIIKILKFTCTLATKILDKIIKKTYESIIEALKINIPVTISKYLKKYKM